MPEGRHRGRTGGPTPAYVRFDHGPEFIAYAVSDLCRFSGTDTVFIDPGSPWQNAWIESFNGRLRDEFLNGQQFASLLEAQVLLEGLAHRLQHQQATQRARLAQAGRVRRILAEQAPAHTRIVEWYERAAEYLERGPLHMGAIGDISSDE